MIVGRNPDKLAAAVKDIEALKTGAIGYEPADITDEEQTLRVVDAATAWHGRLHGVVHCAGGSQTIGPITQIDSQAWRRTVDLNVNGTMYVLKHAARGGTRRRRFVRRHLLDRGQQHPSLVRRLRGHQVGR